MAIRPLWQEKISPVWHMVAPKGFKAEQAPVEGTEQDALDTLVAMGMWT
jgi:hypothetical protein